MANKNIGGETVRAVTDFVAGFGPKQKGWTCECKVRRRRQRAVAWLVTWEELSLNRCWCRRTEPARPGEQRAIVADLRMAARDQGGVRKIRALPLVVRE